MIGISISYLPPDDAEVRLFGVVPGWRRSHIEMKESFEWGITPVWIRDCVYDDDELDEVERVMAALAAATGYRPRELTGFTLFEHPGKGWQMSVQRRGERGWDIKFIPPDQAQMIFDVLETGEQPDGPIVVRSPEQVARLAAATQLQGLLPELVAIADAKEARVALSKALAAYPVPK